MNDILIRKGTREDLPQVHQLVRELAIFERAEEQVITDPEQYARDGFDTDRPLFEFFVAENDHQIVGIAFFYFGYSTWKGKNLYLDDLVITESYRGKGIGTLLLDRLIRYGKEQNAREIRWHVLDWNEPAIKLYGKMKASLDPEWITCKLSYKQIQAYPDH